MEFTTSNQDGKLIISVNASRLTNANASGLIQAVRPEIAELKSVTVDCRHLNLVDSGGLVGLVMLAKLLAAEGLPNPALTHLNASVRKLMRLSNLEKHFEIEMGRVVSD